MEWFDYEPASHQGHMRSYPKGAMICHLIGDWICEVSEDLFGAFQVITPLIYRWKHKGVAEQMEYFRERMYTVVGGEIEFIMKPNADVGTFAALENGQLTYRHLPLRIYELSKNFRNNLGGEVSGIRHASSFTLLDAHSFCANLEQALIEYQTIFKNQNMLMRSLGFNSITWLRTTEEFFDSHQDLIKSMASFQDSPMIVELLTGQKLYWIMKHFTVTGNLKVFHVQLDLDNSKSYGIKFSEVNGKKTECVIVHNSMATIERWFLLFLEDAVKKTPPVLPLWLAPTQVRILPVSELHLDFCLKLAENIKGKKIRVDVDDRPDKLGWRIRAGERDWIEYIVVCGDKEVADGNVLSVRIRGKGQYSMTTEKLVDEIKERTKDMPFRHLPGMLISTRPIFRGRD
jgi:threonyl-tRNA synthetase